jgi:hypothetical protein
MNPDDELDFGQVTDPYEDDYEEWEDDDTDEDFTYSVDDPTYFCIKEH